MCRREVQRGSGGGGGAGFRPWGPGSVPLSAGPMVCAACCARVATHAGQPQAADWEGGEERAGDGRAASHVVHVAGVCLGVRASARLLARLPSGRRPWRNDARAPAPTRPAPTAGGGGRCASRCRGGRGRGTSCHSGVEQLHGALWERAVIGGWAGWALARPHTHPRYHAYALARTAAAVAALLFTAS